MEKGINKQGKIVTLKKKNTIMLNISRSLFVYDNEELDLIKSSNIPAINVEDNKFWESYKTSKGNPNLIGQIHLRGEEVAFDLCFEPTGKYLTKNDLKAIINGIEYVEEFIKKKGV